MVRKQECKACYLDVRGLIIAAKLISQITVNILLVMFFSFSLFSYSREPSIRDIM